MTLANQPILIHNFKNPSDKKEIITEDEVWFMPFDLLLDLWECHKQFEGISKPKVEVFIDEIIPNGI